MNNLYVNDRNSKSHVIYSQKLSGGDDSVPVLEKLLNSVGGLKKKVGQKDKVLIKPNFVAPFPSATTDLTFIDFFINKIRAAGAEPIVGESSGYEFDTEKTFFILGVRAFLKKRNVDIINFEHYPYVSIKLDDRIPPVKIAEVALKSKLIINLPVLKGHAITKVTGATKNFFGLLSKDSRRKLHCGRLHGAIAALASRFSNSLHFVDARSLLTRAVYGETKPLSCCLAGVSPLALDHFGSRLLGINPKSVLHLQNIPEYRVEGTVPDLVTQFSEMESIKEKFHRTMYSVFYQIDQAYSNMFSGKSIIPDLHWIFGIHPALGKVTAGELSDLAKICPVNAVSIEKRRIIREKCKTVRCLKCYRDGPTGAIKLKGLNSPKNEK